MKKIIALTLLIVSFFVTKAQSESNQPVSAQTKQQPQQSSHRIIFQFSTDDTLAQKALLKQMANILSVAPGTKIEVVCHGPGLGMLVTGKTLVHEKIQTMRKKGVAFLACEFSMGERNVPKENIIPEAGFVKAGIIAIVSRQEEGWSYIKSGF